MCGTLTLDSTLQQLFAFDAAAYDDPLSFYDKKIAFYNELLPKLAALPGVRAASRAATRCRFGGGTNEVPL